MRRAIVKACTTCPFAYGGEEWHPFCAAPLAVGAPRLRALPKNHEPDGPPPRWCPLPIVVDKASDGGDQ